jgi:DNA-binding transcriptional MerR regulator
MKKDNGVTVSIAADILGVSLRTLRLWDKSGVLEAKRAKNGYRRYLVSELEAFKQKKNLSKKKMTLVD